MADSSASRVADIAFADPDEAFNRILTEGILQTARETDLHDAELSMEPGGAMMPAVLTKEEFRALSEALGF